MALGRGRIIASGGVSSIDDVIAVQAAGCAGAIVGRALYEGRIDLRALVGELDGRDLAEATDRGSARAPGDATG